MLPEIKKLPVNWIDGMKISSQHFQSLEDSFQDIARDCLAINLTSYNYGLLPPAQGSDRSVDLKLDLLESEKVKVQVIACRAVTSGGVRIELLKSTLEELKTPESFLTSEHSLALAKDLQFDIILTVNPSKRIPVGIPDPGESPPRVPYTWPEIRVELVPYPQINKLEFGISQLNIGRIKVEGNQIVLSHYIPPCTSLKCHPLLNALYNKYFEVLSGIKLQATGIILKIRSQAQQTDLVQNVYRLSDAILTYLTNSIDYYRLILIDQPPIYLVEYFARFVRVVTSTLECMPHNDKELLLNYFREWTGLTPNDFQANLDSLATLEYDHNDINNSMDKIHGFTEILSSLFAKLSQLNLIGDNVIQTQDRVYGWLVLHDPNKEPLAYEIKKNKNLIGRVNAEIQNDIRISGDPTISREHAWLHVVESGGTFQFALEDFKSKNGTYIQGVGRLPRGKSYPVNDGSTLQFGQSTLLLKSIQTAGNAMIASAEAAKTGHVSPFPTTNP